MALFDNFVDRLILKGYNSSATGFDNIGATGQSGEPAQSVTINSVWFGWTAPTNGVVTIDTFGSALDTFLSVFSGSAVNALTLVAQNDDANSTAPLLNRPYDRVLSASEIATLAQLATISINDVRINETASNATFTVTLSAASIGSITVNYSTTNGTATAGSDYTATTGTLTIPAGSTTGTINVPIINDTLVEPNETFTVNLATPVNATILDGQGIGTIISEDRPTLSIGNL
jgi:hypothetical protein